jgi:ABC-2 type transport system permease protein
MEVLLVSFKPLQVILGKVFPYIFLSMINATVIVVLGVLFSECPSREYILLAWEHTFHYNGSFIGNWSTISNSQQTAMISLMG